MSNLYWTKKILVLILIADLLAPVARAEKCGFVDERSPYTSALVDLGAALKRMQPSDFKADGNGPECQRLVNEMGRMATQNPNILGLNDKDKTRDGGDAPPALSPEIIEQRKRILESSSAFFQLHCDESLVDSSKGMGLLGSVVTLARTELNMAMMVPGFFLPGLAINSLIDFIFGALDRLFSRKDIAQSLGEQAQLLTQEEVLCSYFELVTQLDEAFSEDGIRKQKLAAREKIQASTDRIAKLSEQEFELTCVRPGTGSPADMSLLFDFDNWKKTFEIPAEKNDAEVFNKVIEAVESKEWNSEISKAMDTICNPEKNPKPNREQKLACGYHKNLVQTLSKDEIPTDKKEQELILHNYRGLMASIASLKLFKPGMDLKTVRSTIDAERRSITEMERFAEGLTLSDELRRSNIFDNVRKRGAEFFTGRRNANNGRGLMKEVFKVAHETIDRQLDQVKAKPFLRDLREKPLSIS